MAAGRRTGRRRRGRRWRRAARRCRGRESVTACSVEQPPRPSPEYGDWLFRPRVGFSPTRPQQAAGARIEPKPSEACAIGSIRAPTDAAAPPDEPPEIRFGVPGAPGRAVRPGLAGQREPQLARVGAAEDDEPGRLQTADQLAGRRDRWRVLEEVRPARDDVARPPAVQVFEQERHAPERPVRQPGGDGLARTVVPLPDDGVDGAVAGLDALDGGVQQLLGRDLTLAHQLGQPEPIVLFVLCEPRHP